MLTEGKNERPRGDGCFELSLWESMLMVWEL